MWSCILQLSQINEVFGSWLCIIRFWDISDKEERMSSVRYLLNLCIAAVDTDKNTGTRFSTLLSSVCSYKTFPFNKDEYDDDDYYINHYQREFLLDLYSHVMNYETQTGRSYLPALQSVFQSPDVWIINFSERKISVLLEVLKLQTEKKTVDLIRCSEEEREVMSFLQCLTYISQLRWENLWLLTVIVKYDFFISWSMFSGLNDCL